VNKVMLIGRLTADPELRHTANGTAVCDLRMATSRVSNSKTGESKEEKLFIDVTVWQRDAENACQYLAKGSMVHIEGHLKMEQWEDKNSGEKRSKIKIESERVTYLDSKKKDQDESPRIRDEEDDEVPVKTVSSKKSNKPVVDDDDMPF